MDNIDNDDLLSTNRFVPNIGVSGGYGMTDEIRRHRLREHVERKAINLHSIDTDQEREIMDDDMLKTNPVLDENGILRKDLDKGRHIKEIRTVLNINSIQRQQIDNTQVVERNPETGLYTRYVEDSNGVQQTQLYNVDILNNEFEPGPTDIHRPYFNRPDADIGKKVFRFPDPNYYKIQLPRKFSNVKSIRLLSVEVPNTLNLINEYNNLILLDIRDQATGKSITLKTGVSPFKFFLFQLTPGSYSLTELAQHMEDTVNDLVLNYSVSGFDKLFTITINEITGKVSIKLNDPAGHNLTFHWRFWFKHDLDGELPITQFQNLWYLLGFAEPYQIAQDGSDVYTKERTNLFDFGINSLINGVVPDDLQFHVVKPFRFPEALPNKYIYLTIKGLGALDDIQNPDITNFQANDLFGKIIFDVAAGETTHRFVSNPKIFPNNTLPTLEDLVIKWIDYAGLPVDFQLRNHSFTLEIVEYSDQLDSVNYDSRRGTIDKTSYPDIVKFNTGS